jgi:hypothetical protein
MNESEGWLPEKTRGLLSFSEGRYQEKYFDVAGASFENRKLGEEILLPTGEYVLMSGQVILYFEDQADALRFALAAGSVMAGEAGKFTDDLVEETTRATRIRLDAANAGNGKKAGAGRAA